MKFLMKVAKNLKNLQNLVPFPTKWVIWIRVLCIQGFATENDKFSSWHRTQKLEIIAMLFNRFKERNWVTQRLMLLLRW